MDDARFRRDVARILAHGSEKLPELFGR